MANKYNTNQKLEVIKQAYSILNHYSQTKDTVKNMTEEKMQEVAYIADDKFIDQMKQNINSCNLYANKARQSIKNNSKSKKHDSDMFLSSLKLLDGRMLTAQYNLTKELLRRKNLKHSKENSSQVRPSEQQQIVDTKQQVKEKTKEKQATFNKDNVKTLQQAYTVIKKKSNIFKDAFTKLKVFVKKNIMDRFSNKNKNNNKNYTHSI